MNRLFELRALDVRYGDKSVLRDVALLFHAGEFATIAGPNGAGKSTLLGIMSGLKTGYAGSCRYRDHEVKSWDRRKFAREVAVVPQSVRIDFPFTAEQVVLMGRAPFANSLFESDEDRYQVQRVMNLTGVWEFRNRDFRTLSGGEKQRVVVASALAQMPAVLLLDEPTAYLDIEHQLALYRLLQVLCKNGVLVVAVTHDLNLAGAYSDRIVLLSRGAMVADGPPAAVLESSTLREVFHVDTNVLRAPGGYPWIQYGP